MPVRAPRPLTRSGQCLCPRTCPFCSADDSREGLPAIRLHPDGSRRRVSLAIDELALVLLEEDPNVVPWKWRSPPQVGTGWLLEFGIGADDRATLPDPATTTMAGDHSSCREDVACGRWNRHRHRTPLSLTGRSPHHHSGVSRRRPLSHVSKPASRVGNTEGKHCAGRLGSS